MSLGQLGPYLLEEELGRGGMGAVYRARRADLDQRVALKVGLWNGASPAERHALSARFLREARAMARLRHPHVVAVHRVDSDPASGRPYLVMQWVPGGDLNQLLREQGPLRQRHAVELAQALAGALTAAHAQGILHRDLKPANVLLDEAGQPLLTDFGLAKLLDRETRLTLSGDVLGTPSYMAPEQALGRQELIGPATDVFGVGALLYRMLTGRAPYQGASVIELLQQAAAGSPPPATSLRPDLHPALAALLARCLQADPSQRPASAAELEQALADVGAQLGEPAGRPRRSAALAAVSLVAGAIGLGGWIWASQPEPTRPPPRATSPTPPPSEAARADQVEALLQQASAHLRRREFRQAEAIATRALALDPTPARGWRIRGTARLDAQRYADAVSDLSEALARNPEDALARRNRAVAYLRQGQPEQGLEDMLRVDVEPQDERVFWALAEALYQRGTPPASALALRAATQVTELAPSRYDAWELRALARLHVGGDAEVVLVELDHLLALQGDEAGPWVLRASVFEQLGRRDEAEADLRRAIAVEPTVGLPRLKLVRFLCDGARYDEAWALLESAFELDLDRHERPMAHWARGFVEAQRLKATGYTLSDPRVRPRAQAALRDLERAWELGLRVDTFDEVRAGLLLGAGDDEGALAVAETSLQGQPRSLIAWLTKATALRRLGRLEACLAAYEASAELVVDADPATARAHAQGWALARELQAASGSSR